MGGVGGVGGSCGGERETRATNCILLKGGLWRIGSCRRLWRREKDDEEAPVVVALLGGLFTNVLA